MAGDRARAVSGVEVAELYDSDVSETCSDDLHLREDILDDSINDSLSTVMHKLLTDRSIMSTQNGDSTQN